MKKISIKVHLSLSKRKDAVKWREEIEKGGGGRGKGEERKVV